MRRLFPLLAVLALGACVESRATGDLGLVIERADSSVVMVDTTKRERLARIEGLGDMSHASLNFSRDERFAYVFGRDGGLTKIDMLTEKVVKRIVQGGNSIGGAISQDGRLVAVSNYEPGGVRIFDADTLEMVADIPTLGPDGKPSKTVGLVDVPGQKFVVSLFEAGEIWVIDMKDPKKPGIRKFPDIGKLPYDALITADGRYYVAGLFGEDGLAMLDLWNLDKGVRRVLDGYGKGEQKLPVYKMPHLEGWTIAGNEAFIPAVGRHEVLVVDLSSWKEAGRVPVHGQPVFVVGRPDGRQAWVNFALPHNDTIQVIDVPSRKIVKEFKPGGAGVLHMEFTPRGHEVWVSVRDSDKVVVYDTETLEKVKELPALKPSGIFFTPRAHRTGL